MKTRFTTLDICAVVTELKENAIGLRLANIYDIDNKTYLLKLIKPDTKKLLLIESGIRMHLSEFDWPKNTFPSGFAMKLRKHLRGRRLVAVTQLGIDRIVDLQFGSNEAAFHMIIELYDRGNIALTDCNYVILNLLRYRRQATTTKDDKKDEDSDVRIAVHEEYPIKSARPHEPLINLERLVEILQEGRTETPVKRILNSHLPYGISTIEHCLCTAGFTGNAKKDVEFDVARDSEKLHTSLQNGENLLRMAMSVCSKGYIIQKSEKKLIDGSEMLTNVEFQPHLFHQHKQLPHVECDSFNKAVDEFFGALESQRNDMKALQRERVAMKKLENVRKDHQNRISGLRVEQDNDYLKATLIEANLADVDKAIRVICGAIANQLDWSDIEALVRDAQSQGDPVASQIRSLKLQTNSFMMALSMPDYDSDLSSEEENGDEKPNKEEKKSKPLKIEIDLSLSAYGNAARYYTMKRQAANKEQRTIESSEKAFKSAEKKTTQSLKEAATIHNIQKARKVYWFEKFIWFISTENYLVIGGHDAQQNEILVKKYLRAGDVYVHADLHGATSCIIKNNDPSMPIPPKTLNEAGTMAICHSAAWDAKVVTSAWWVKHDQVSKTAPSGEYLTTGSFLIRGKKNYLPPSYLVYGFGFLFKVDETCIWKHKEERRVRNAEEEDDAGVNKVDMMIEVANNNKDVGSGGHEIDDVIKEEDEKEEEEEDDETGKADCGDKDEDADCNCDGENDDVNVMQGGDSDKDSMKTTTSSTVVDFAFPDTQLKVDYQAPQLSPSEEKLTVHHEGKARLSAKERRDLRKQKKLGNNPQQQQQQQNATTTEARESEQKSVNKKNSDSNIQNKQQKNKENPPPPQAPQPKRGQKKKLKKIKQKYKDQDEEDRQLVMEFLQSAKGPKAKDKKGKEKHQHGSGRNNNRNPAGGGKNNSNYQQQQQQGTKVVASDNKDITRQEGGEVGGVKKEETHEEGVENNNKMTTTTGKLKSLVADVNDGDNSDEEREQTLKNEHLDIEPVTNVLESLTGCPCADDILLFAIPVCAPYNAMQNYKFKVKLTPGSNKKGKATKTALNMFQSTRETTPQEKDHLRSVKDYDLSKNVPGKVKLSAPNLQGLKQKNKKNKR